VQSGLTSEMVWELHVEVADEGSAAKWSAKVTIGDQVLSVSTGALQLVTE